MKTQYDEITQDDEPKIFLSIYFQLGSVPHINYTYFI